MNKIQVNKSARSSFKLEEYKEASTAYFKGVDIGLGYFRLFFLINAFLITAYLTAWKIAFDTSSQALFSSVMLLVSIIGCAVGILLFSLLGYFGQQLDHCIDRAITLEQQFNGSLFQAIKGTEEKFKPPLKRVKTLVKIFIVAWMLAALYGLSIFLLIVFEINMISEIIFYIQQLNDSRVSK